MSGKASSPEDFRVSAISFAREPVSRHMLSRNCRPSQVQHSCFSADLLMTCGMRFDGICARARSRAPESNPW